MKGGSYIDLEPEVPNRHIDLDPRHPCAVHIETALKDLQLERKEGWGHWTGASCGEVWAAQGQHGSATTTSPCIRLDDTKIVSENPRSSDHHSCSMWPRGPQCEVQRRMGLCAVHQSYRNLRRSTRYKKVYNQYRPKQSSKRKSTILSRERFASICTGRRRDDNGLTTSPSLLCRITMAGRCQRVIWARGWPPCASTCLVYTSSHSKCGAAIKSPATTAETPFQSQFATTRRTTAGLPRATTTEVATTTQTASRSSVTTPFCSKS